MCIVRDLVMACYRELGQADPDPEMVRAVEIALRQKYAGERVYIAAHPKARVLQLAHQAGHDARKLATLAGISPRHARRLLNGR
jgi:hypothetical protein